MTPLPRLVGMVHLRPLPGSPRFEGSSQKVFEAAVADADALATAGFPSLLIENFGDAPFYPGAVPPETIAAMAVAAEAVREATDLPLGVNVLRNDALAALGVSTAVGASFIRVNVLNGMMFTDQGAISGDAARVLRERDRLAPDVEIWADVMVKHAVPPPGLEAGDTARDLVERGLADAVIVSGRGTGSEPNLEEASAVASAVPKGTRLVTGSGARSDNLARLLEVTDTVIVGSAVKVDGDPTQEVDPLRAGRFVESARRHGLL